VIEDPPRLALDLYIVHHVLPREDGRLALDDARVGAFRSGDLASELGLGVVLGGLGLGVVAALVEESLGDVTPGEDEDLALGSFGGDEFCSGQRVSPD
jgi:hypothetical protein